VSKIQNTKHVSDFVNSNLFRLPAEASVQAGISIFGFGIYIPHYHHMDVVYHICQNKKQKS